MVTWYGRDGAGAHALAVWLLGCWVCCLLPILELGLVYVIMSLLPNRVATSRGNETVSNPSCFKSISLKHYDDVVPRTSQQEFHLHCLV